MCWFKNRLHVLTAKAQGPKILMTSLLVRSAEDKAELPVELSSEAATIICILKSALDAKAKERSLVESATFATHKKSSLVSKSSP